MVVDGMSRYCRILRFPPGAVDGFARVNAAVEGLRISTGKKFHAMAPDLGDEDERGVRKWVETESHANVLIELVNDLSLPYAYLEIADAADDGAQVVTEALESALQTMSIDDLKVEAESHFASRPGLLVLLAIASDSEEPSTFMLLRRALAADDADVRANAVMATTLLRWPSFFPLLEKMQEREADDGVRHLLEYALEARA
jgi:hypothetical protein